MPSWGGYSQVDMVRIKKDIEPEVFNDEVQAELLELARPWSEFQVIRRHAALALVPQLDKLTPAEATRLIYFVFFGKLGVHWYVQRGWGGACLQSHVGPVLVDFAKRWVEYGDQNSDEDPRPLSKKRRIGIEQLLFNCALPRNVVDALCSFFLDQRIPNELEDQLSTMGGTAPRMGVGQYFLARIAVTQPDLAHVVYNAFSSALLKGGLLAEQPSFKNRFSGNAPRYDYDFFDRREVGKIVEIVIDCEAIPCIPAVRHLYKNYPRAINHSAVAYGRGGLLVALALLGVGSKLKRSDAAREISTMNTNVRISFGGGGSQASAGEQMLRGMQNEAANRGHLVQQMEANTDSRVSPRTYACAMCGKKGKSKAMKRCAQCKCAVYCSRSCQRTHWKTSHKRDCVAKEK